MVDLIETWNRMHEAATKAVRNSELFNERDREIEERAKLTCANRGIIKKGEIEQRISIAKDADDMLAKYFKRYTFWKGEQERCSNLIQGEVAYQQWVGEMITKIPVQSAKQL